MKKINFVLSLLICISSLCFAVPPQPTDQSSFREGNPSHSIPPTPRATYPTPIPTNKWFTSIIYNPYDFDIIHSLKMYTYPQVYKCDAGAGHSKGLLISYPKTQYRHIIVPTSASFPGYEFDTLAYGYDSNAYAYPNNIKVSGYSEMSEGKFISYVPKINSFSNSDFSITIKWENNSNWMKATIGQGFVFSYFEYDDSTYPALEYPYDWNSTYGSPHLYKPDGTEIGYALDIDTGNSDRIIYETRFPDGRSVFYGIFVPQGTSFKQYACGDNFNRIFLVLPTGKKYFSIGLLPSTNITDAKADLELYYRYAYNFVTKTEVSWEVGNDYSSKTNFNFTIDKKGDVEQGFGTLFCLYPHQYDNLASQTDIISDKSFDTLRGNLKLASGKTFSTKTKFYGIVPFFQYDVKDVKETIFKYLKEEYNINPTEVSKNPYRAGKVIAKLANMLPVADNLNESLQKEALITKLNTLLSDWFTYLDSEKDEGKYFAYDTIWGGLEGMKDGEFFSYKYNDHHFHYGYFIYSAAILAMYDDSFVNKYGQMVNLLIKDIANYKKGDPDFPFMRHFDFYESHSWANGMGGNDDRGIDQESSSEAMNAWAAIYLWGLVTGNKDLEKLGIYLYSNEYEGTKYYYFDINKNILKSPYNHNSVGLLRGGSVDYDIYFEPRNSQAIKGIQVLPMIPAMTYFAYNKEYIRDFYNTTTTEVSPRASDSGMWYDIWARLISLYDPSTALAKFNTYKTNPADEGSSKCFSYHFINFFNKCGTPSFTYTADTSSYMVLEKNSTKTYCAYNPSNSYKNIHFYDASGEDLGYLSVGAKSFASSSKLINGEEIETISVFPVPYKPHSGGKFDANGISFLGVTVGSNIKIFNIAGEKVFEKTISDTGNLFVWDAKNDAGNEVASGIYIYYITSSGQKIKGKLAIER